MSVCVFSSLLGISHDPYATTDPDPFKSDSVNLPALQPR